MIQNLTVLVVLAFFCTASALADDLPILQVAENPPSDLSFILKKIKDRESKEGFSDLQGDLSETQDKASLMSTISQLKIVTTFSLKSPTIEKRITMKQGSQDTAFTAVLDQTGKSFKHLVDYQKNWKIIFFRHQDVFIYSLQKDHDGNTFLKEWIYARAPNTPSGSCYTWKFHPDPFGWPVTVEQETGGQWGVYRNMPVSDVHFSDFKKREHISSVVHKLLPKVYFPFHELLVEVPTVEYRTMEETKRIGILQANGNDGLAVCAPASTSDYPLLIDPSFMIKK